MGAADYLAIGENFHTVIVEGVPKLNVLSEANVVRRFIIFVDSMYECNVKLVLHAEARLSELFSIEANSSSSDEAFAIDRTRSRLEEMGSETYLRKLWVGAKNHAQDHRCLSNDAENHVVSV
jgi:predicted ATPase